jgi:hypothetical protein
VQEARTEAQESVASLAHDHGLPITAAFSFHAAVHRLSPRDKFAVGGRFVKRQARAIVKSMLIGGTIAHLHDNHFIAIANRAEAVKLPAPAH